ncbi:MAG: PRC-barrel domain-containing protein [Patescibacteria group bacterium]
MILDIKTIKKLNVETESGVALGKIIDLEIDTTNHSVIKYLVTKTKFLNTSEKLLISPAQIIRVTETKIIVQDTLEPIANERISVKSVSANEAPAMNSDRT